MNDRLYFRQLLSGRDFAQHDNVARQMVNFVYLIGDRETGEAVAVDPAYDIPGLLDILATDGMKLTGALATRSRVCASCSRCSRFRSTCRATKHRGSSE